MSPEKPNRNKKVLASNNIYTAILAFSFAVVLATAAFVALKCKSQYGTIFGSPEKPRSYRSARN
jgi:hypothetical protein